MRRLFLSIQTVRRTTEHANIFIPSTAMKFFNWFRLRILYILVGHCPDLQLVTCIYDQFVLNFPLFFWIQLGARVCQPPQEAVFTHQHDVGIFYMLQCKLPTTVLRFLGRWSVSFCGVCTKHCVKRSSSPMMGLGRSCNLSNTYFGKHGGLFTDGTGRQATF